MMAKQNEPARQLPDWIVDHMRKYVETDGKEGHIWNGVPTLVADDHRTLLQSQRRCCR